jgi:hypothetical protein
MISGAPAERELYSAWIDQYVEAGERGRYWQCHAVSKSVSTQVPRSFRASFMCAIRANNVEFDTESSNLVKASLLSSILTWLLHHKVVRAPPATQSARPALSLHLFYGF